VGWRRQIHLVAGASPALSVILQTIKGNYVMDENQITKMEAEEILRSRRYFAAKPSECNTNLISSLVGRRKLFKDGFERGYKAGMKAVIKEMEAKNKGNGEGSIHDDKNKT
jgi:hypothetical protein